jgi:hypothetical protein
MNLVERSVYEIMQKHEIVKSIYSDHEMKHFEDLRRAKRLQDGKADEKDIEAAAKQTALDFEDASSIEFKTFSTSARQTADDSSGNQRSLNRNLAKRLVLLTKFRLGIKPQWLLPSALHQEGESLRQTAERALVAILGPESELRVKFLGNIPASSYVYKYPKPVQKATGKAGGKMFFFKAQLVSGNVNLEQSNKEVISDFLWLDRQEASQLMLKEGTTRYWNSISNSFLTEGLNEKEVAKILSKVRRRFLGKEEEKESVVIQ